MKEPLISDEAKDDLAEIWATIAEARDERAADRMNGKILSSCREKAQFSDLLLVAFLVLVLHEAWRRRARVPALARPAALLLVTVAVAALAARDVRRGLVEVAGLGSLVATLLAVALLVATAERLLRALQVLACGAAAVGALAVAGVAVSALSAQPNTLVDLDATFRSLLPLPRAVATFRHPNLLAPYLHVGLAAALLLLRLGRVPPAVVVAIAGGLAASQSRQVVGALLTVVMVVAVEWPRARLARLTWLPLLALLCGATLNHFWLLVPFRAHLEAGPAVRLSYSDAPSRHLVLDDAALRMVRAHPLTGVGPGRFPRALPAALDPDLARPAYHAAGQPLATPLDPHSTYLGWAAEAGVPTLLAILLLFGSALRRADGLPRPWRTVMVATLCGFLLDGWQLDILTLRPLWAWLGLVAGPAALRDDLPSAD